MKCKCLNYTINLIFKCRLTHDLIMVHKLVSFLNGDQKAQFFILGAAVFFAITLSSSVWNLALTQNCNLCPERSKTVQGVGQHIFLPFVDVTRMGEPEAMGYTNSTTPAHYGY